MSIIVFISLVSLAIILTVLVVGSLCENGDAVSFGIVFLILWTIFCFLNNSSFWRDIFYFMDYCSFSISIWCKMAT